MVNVLLTGPTPVLDRRRVSFAKLLQREAHLSLSTAKEYMERCLLGETVTVEMPTRAAAQTLVEEATRLGAIAEITGVRQPR